MTDIIVKTDALTKAFGSTVALDNANIEIRRGSIVGLVGKNGAGKTTLIKVLCGLITPTSGTFSVLQGQRSATSVAAIVEKPALYNGMCAMDNLVMQCKLLGITKNTQQLETLLADVGLSAANRNPAKDYSLGMKQRLAIAMSLVGEPELLILDEPTNGLDPQGIVEIRTLLEKLNKQNGITIVISSHILSELGKLATDYVFIDNGKVVACLSAQQLHKTAAKRTRIVASDYAAAQTALSAIGQTEQGNGYIDVFGDATTTEIFSALALAGVEVYSINCTSDDLENFFVTMVKEGNNEKHN